MWNILLDKLPDNFEGFKINSDFRIGIQIFQVLNDDQLAGFEKYGYACSLLFLDEEGKGEIPDAAIAQEAVKWFLSGWYTDNTVENEDKEQRKDMDYDIDQWRIYSAFLTQFGIDLNTTDMHFWVFMGLLSTLEECAFTRVIDARTCSIDPKADKSTKKALKDMKKRYSLGDGQEEQLSPQEQAELDAFMAYAKKKIKPPEGGG